MNAPPPLVSVVIPTHNRAGMLPEAIASVWRQGLDGLEAIVVDDGSNDETPHLLQRLEKPQLRHLRHPTPRGGAAARNSGMRAAQGRYIAFLDDDDRWEADKLRLQLPLIEQADAVLCGARLKSSGRRDGSYRKPTITLDDLRRGFVFGAGASSLVVRADLARQLWFDEALPCGQDWDFLVRLALQGARIRYLPEPLVVFDDGGHGRITNAGDAATAAQLERRLAALKKHRDVIGQRWYRYHAARRLLYNLRKRPDAIRHLTRTIVRCGPIAVGRVYYERLRQATT